ncbi:hypothetical protein DPMN_140061 [Dreissena polymorpha]|uniref:Uncharacterized protein n=1 Tax=Dreissena polymorpha TaxID=45954 RepID=A0A9D4G9S0_DREPO|nr:hypothetical protein DPMN_140061 [Dreissena polymorpha]
MSGKSSELQDLTSIFYEKARSYAMEVSTEKTKTIVNSAKHTSEYINMNQENLE